MRIRQRVPSTYSVTYTHQYTAWSGTTSDPWRVSANTTNNVAQSFRQDRYMEDVVTPNFRKLISLGHVINNPMYKYEVEELFAGGNLDMKFIQYSTTNPVYYTGWGAVGKWAGGLMTGSCYKSAPSVDVQSVQDKAVTDAFAKNKANDTLLLATMGELRETVSSLSSIFKRAARILWAVKRANFRALRKEITPKELSSRYMEARYALRPLVYDVTQTLEAFNNEQKQKRFTARAFASESGTDSDVVLGYTHTNYQIYFARSVQRTVEARSGVLSAVDTLSRINVWGLDQVASSAWELVPLSFVVDWFFNIGKLVAAWSPTMGLRQLASWVVIKDVTIQSSRVDHTVCLQPTVRIHQRYMNYTAAAVKTTSSKRRIVNPALNIYPSFNVRLDGWKLLDLGIILKNILK